MQNLTTAVPARFAPSSDAIHNRMSLATVAQVDHGYRGMVWFDGVVDSRRSKANATLKNEYASRVDTKPSEQR